MKPILAYLISLLVTLSIMTDFMRNQIKTTHSDIEILYDEKADVWRFELRGRDRSAESLTKAKEVIDKPPKNAEDAKPFTRIKAYVSFGLDMVECEVTSEAEPSRFGGARQFWIVCDGERKKRSASDIIPRNPSNDALVAEWLKLQEQENQLNTAKREIEAQLTSLK